MDIDGKTSSRHPPWRKFPLENAPNHSPEAGNVSCHEKASQPSGIFFSLKKIPVWFPKMFPPLPCRTHHYPWVNPRSFWIHFGFWTRWIHLGRLGRSFIFILGSRNYSRKEALGPSSPNVNSLNPVPKWIQDFQVSKISRTSWAVFSMVFQPFGWRNIPKNPNLHGSLESSLESKQGQGSPILGSVVMPNSPWKWAEITIP